MQRRDPLAPALRVLVEERVAREGAVEVEGKVGVALGAFGPLQKRREDCGNMCMRTARVITVKLCLDRVKLCLRPCLAGWHAHGALANRAQPESLSQSSTARGARTCQRTKSMC